jgi:hypothetical protein
LCDFQGNVYLGTRNTGLDNNYTKRNWNKCMRPGDQFYLPGCQATCCHRYFQRFRL